jgi:hypothetical protein
MESRSFTLFVRNTLNIYPPNYEKCSFNSELHITDSLKRSREVDKYSFETNAGVDPKAQLWRGWGGLPGRN